MISILVQYIGIALLKISIVVRCIGNKMLMIRKVVQLFGIALLKISIVVQFIRMHSL